MRLIHTNRHGLELSKRLFENRTVDSEVLDELDPEVSVAPEAEGKMSYERKFTRSPTGMVRSIYRNCDANTDEQTALVISSFYLSTLPTVSSRQVHLRQLLSSSAPYIILVDRASPEGWQAISEARSYILSLADDPSADAWHLIAPCPHEYDCPLAGGRDRCSFSQKLQRPSFTRKTKHANRGEEDVNYTYLVIGKGPRPAKKQGMALDSLVSDIGRLGGVGKEALEKEAIKREGKSELKEVEGGEFEMVSMSELPTASSDVEGQTGEEIELGLRGEAYTWPRVVAPPMKRAGHVILDTCFPDGMSPSFPAFHVADRQATSND
jgi:ribosomal protein RSM22 (predicted rRNA methylase)